MSKSVAELRQELEQYDSLLHNMAQQTEQCKKNVSEHRAVVAGLEQDLAKLKELVGQFAKDELSEGQEGLESSFSAFRESLRRKMDKQQKVLEGSEC
jgi:uncharacterized protein YukE